MRVFIVVKTIKNSMGKYRTAICGVIKKSLYPTNYKEIFPDAEKCIEICDFEKMQNQEEIRTNTIII